MADVHNGHDSPGIKLFGKTIIAAVQPIKEIKDEVPNKSQENNEEETLVEKRTDKIIPCPRCKSLETKFCYFNNYNVNQPRHFCKGCQRYWTAGGALRNVPIGAGRRKTKPPLCSELSGTFSDNSFLDDTSSGIHFDGGVVEEWHLAAVAAAQGGFHHGFPAKRRRSTSSGQSY